MKNNRLSIGGRLVCLLLCGALGGCSAADRAVDAARYVQISCTGYNGEGTATLSVDEAALADAVYRAMGLSATPESGTTEANTAAGVLSALTISATPETALSNGDSVQIHGVVDTDALESAGVLLSFTDFNALVSGLDTTRPLDPFENVTVSWDGYSPGITMLVNLTNTTTEPWSWISYTADHNTDLRAGDTVTLTATADAATLENLGYELTRTTQTYTVPDYQGNYLLDWSYLDAAGQSTLKSKAELAAMMANLRGATGLTISQNGTTLAALDGSNTLTATNYALYTTFYLTSKTGEKPADGPGWYNALVGVYRFDVTSGDGEALPVYAAFALPNVSMTASGLVFQSDDAVYYRVADTDPAALSLIPEGAGNAYRVAPVDFSLAATMETAASP